MRKWEYAANMCHLIQDEEGNFIFIRPPNLRGYTWIYHGTLLRPWELKRDNPR